MEKVLDKKKCSGCTACVNICPKQAIKMEVEEDGFRYPVINQEKCINCELCKKTCPVFNTKSNDTINKCYVAYSKNEEYSDNSSSGGIFPLIADLILEKKGLVIGAAFDENNKLKHIAISKKEDLIKLKGSKYLQSDLDDIFKFIKNNIESKKILFVGTPCQVSGLKAYLKKDYNNLLTIDLFCHGVPSQELFDKYIEWVEKKNKEKVISYNFRDKSTGWDTYSITINLESKKITQDRRKNAYMKLFLSDLALRECCYQCNFKLGNKYSDITLGDFWGVRKYYPEMFNKNGVSAIIINTSKGNDLFVELNQNLKCKECKLEEIISENISLKFSSNKPEKRAEFFLDMKMAGFDKINKKYLRKASLLKRVVNLLKKNRKDKFANKEQ